MAVTSLVWPCRGARMDVVYGCDQRPSSHRVCPLISKNCFQALLFRMMGTERVLVHKHLKSRAFSSWLGFLVLELLISCLLSGVKLALGFPQTPITLSAKSRVNCWQHLLKNVFIPTRKLCLERNENLGQRSRAARKSAWESGVCKSFYLAV